MVGVADRTATTSSEYPAAIVQRLFESPSRPAIWREENGELNCAQRENTAQMAVG
jgi:hypothetical protein